MFGALQALNRKHGLHEVLEFRMSPLGGSVAVIETAGGRAEIALQGAQVLSWQPAGHEPVLWLSPATRLGAAGEVRGGIPVCWPWFGAHPSDPAKPAHGFVRSRLWDVTASERQADGARLQLETVTTGQDGALWPHAAAVELTISVGARLGLALTTRNVGSEPFVLGQALHTYLAVGDIADTRIEGFDGLNYIDKVDASTTKQQSGAVHVDREVDRIYLGHAGDAVVVDETLARRIRVAKTGSRSSVVWNPWIDKSARLGDMGEGGYRNMVCVETANAGADTVELPPGGTHTITAAITVEAL